MATSKFRRMVLVIFVVITMLIVVGHEKKIKSHHSVPSSVLIEHYDYDPKLFSDPKWKTVIASSDPPGLIVYINAGWEPKHFESDSAHQYIYDIGENTGRGVRAGKTPCKFQVMDRGYSFFDVEFKGKEFVSDGGYFSSIPPTITTTQMHVYCRGAGFLERLFSTPYSNALPYEAGVPGYAMLAKWSAAQSPIRPVNCRHATKKEDRIGGWQAVNLPPDKWIALLARWQSDSNHYEIPFAWCGKPDPGRKLRIVFFAGTGTLSDAHAQSIPAGNLKAGDLCWGASGRILEESCLKEELDKMNHYLIELDEKPIDIDVPDSIAWQLYDVSGAPGSDRKRR